MLPRRAAQRGVAEGLIQSWNMVLAFSPEWRNCMLGQRSPSVLGAAVLGAGHCQAGEKKGPPYSEDLNFLIFFSSGAELFRK